MATLRQRCVLPFALLSILLAAFLSCDDDSGPSGPDPAQPLVYGALVTPRVSMEADPLLVDGYQNLGADGFTVAHLALSWAQVERGPFLRDWRVLDLHVHNARQRGIKLSVVVEILHGGEVEVPAWLGSEFPGWESQDLAWAFARFLRDMGERAQGTVSYLWLGEGVDRYAAANPGDDSPMIAFFSASADSARVDFPGARIGTLVNPATVAETGEEQLVRALRPSLDLLGLCLEPAVAADGSIDPQTEIARIEESVAAWSDGAFAIVEVGYPSIASFVSSEAEQADFASLLAQWLGGRPAGMELFCWLPLHDAGVTLADSLARRRYPSDQEGKDLFASLLACIALRRNDGSPKPGRQRFFEERP